MYRGIGVPVGAAGNSAVGHRLHLDGARNVPAAICSAAASSLLGIVVTPLLVMLLMGAGDGSGSGLDAVGKIRCCSCWYPSWPARAPAAGSAPGSHVITAGWKFVDQGSILLVVYTAFSDAVAGGLWQLVPMTDLVGLTFVCRLLLAIVLWITQMLALRLGFSVEDCITIVAGSKKSLATGVPMAQILFAGAAVGPLILPLMLFHQIQLMVCAALAQHYAQRDETPAGAADAT
ncbi:MAG: bile acid:sodium symporter [Rhodocyclaceae bacterium]